MYPFRSDTIFVRNAWYMAAWADEIADGPIARTIMEEPIVFFRDGDGVAAALWGLCPHRYHPLADGGVVDGAIVCPYHGFRFDRQGRCALVPGQGSAPERFRARTYPLAERWKLLWIWMGDPALADEALLPPLDDIGLGAPGWTSVANGITYVRSRPQLLIDNLMDLSHIGFLHAKSLQQPEAGEAVPQYDNNATFTARRFIQNMSPDVPYFRQGLPENTQPIDVEVGSHFYGPALIVTYNDVFGDPADNGERPIVARFRHIHGITPETRHTTHDFSAAVRNVRPDAPDYDQFIRDVIKAAREEDVDALEKIEAIVDRFGDARSELAGANDLSVLRVRRHMQKLLDGEEQMGVALPPAADVLAPA